MCRTADIMVLRVLFVGFVQWNCRSSIFNKTVTTVETLLHCGRINGHSEVCSYFSVAHVSRVTCEVTWRYFSLPNCFRPPLKSNMPQVICSCLILHKAMWKFVFIYSRDLVEANECGTTDPSWKHHSKKPCITFHPISTITLASQEFLLVKISLKTCTFIISSVDLKAFTPSTNSIFRPRSRWNQYCKRDLN